MRLDKYLTQASLTRSQARARVAQGRVCVGGAVARSAAMEVSLDDCVTLDGARVDYRRYAYIMINKPRGVLTATRDAREKTVLDFIEPALRRRALGPVGRLDKDVSGLVLLTDDGQLAHRLISPKWSVNKVYMARVDGALDVGHIEAMARGVPLGDFTARPAALEILRDEQGQLARLTVTEGRFHQVKRMFAALGRPVLELWRVSIGGVALDEALGPGEYRALSGAEVGALCALTGLGGREESP